MPRTTCDNCGSTIAATARSCPECGTRVDDEPAPDVHTFGRPPESLLGLGKRFATLRERGRAAVESLSVQSQARRELIAIRVELEQLAAERGTRLRALGDAVYRDDEAGTAATRASIGELDERIAANEAQMTEVTERTHERVEQVRAQSRPTELLDPRPPAPPEPAPPTIPEPYPPPDEGTPPMPTPVPEPYPPPDEADPPKI